MQFPDVAEKLGQEIDLDAYMNGTFRGLLARFVSYDKEFRQTDQPSNAVPSTDAPEDQDDPDDDVSETDDENIIVTPTTLTDAQSISLAQKHVSELLKKAFGKSAINLQHIKSSAKTRFKNIAAHLPNHIQFAFEAYIEFLLKIDQSQATGKSFGSFKDIILGEASDHAKKIKINIQYVFESLAKLYPRRKIYEIFHGLTGPKNLLKIRQRILEVEKTRVLGRLDEFESRLMSINLETLSSNPAEFEPFAEVYNRLVWVFYQVRVSIEVGNEAVKYKRG
jgi:hypothetical protein